MPSLLASSAHRWVPCPGSPAMERPFPSVPHQVAREGSAAHWVASVCLCLKNPKPTPQSMLGRVHANGTVVDIEMVEHVDTYLQEVRSVEIEDPLYVEEHLSSTWLHPHIKDSVPDAWRYCSATQVLYLWEFKYGWRPVDPVANWQFVTYLASILAFLGNVAVTRIEAIIVQPRPAHYEGRVRRWHTTPAELGALFTEVLEAANAATGDSPQCRTGAWCRDCRALAHCPYAGAAALAAIEVSGRVVHATPTPEETASELNILKAAKEALGLRLTAIETLAVSTIEKGGMVPGYAMERSYGRRRWKNLDEMRAVETMTGVSLFDQKPVTPAEAKRRKLDPITLALYSFTPETGNKLVKRNLNKKAAEVFGATNGESK